MSLWKRIRHRIEAAGVRLFAWFIPRLARGSCVRLANALGEIACRLDRRGRAVALANIECALGDTLTPEQRLDAVRASYRNFARTMLDLFWAQRLTPEDWRAWMQPAGFEEIRAQLAREKRGVIFMGVHQGNWEWTNLVCGHLGFGNAVVVENFKNPRLTALFRTLREHSGETVLDQANSLRRMLTIVKRGGATGMLIDLNLRPTQAATVIEGFGMKMCVPLLHCALAQRANALLVPLTSEPRADGTVRIVAHPAVEFPPGASLAEIAQRCWDTFEPILRARPDLWLWPYKHFRYRPRDAGCEYPAYSNDSAKFEKLLRSV